MNTTRIQSGIPYAMLAKLASFKGRNKLASAFKRLSSDLAGMTPKHGKHSVPVDARGDIDCLTLVGDLERAYEASLDIRDVTVITLGMLADIRHGKLDPYTVGYLNLKGVWRLEKESTYNYSDGYRAWKNKCKAICKGVGTEPHFNGDKDIDECNTYIGESPNGYWTPVGEWGGDSGKVWEF